MKIFFLHMLIVVAGCAILQDANTKSPTSSLTNQMGGPVIKNISALSSFISKEQSDRILRLAKRKLENEEAQVSSSSKIDEDDSSSESDSDDESSESDSPYYNPNLYGSKLSPETEDVVMNLIDEFLDWEYDILEGEKTIDEDDLQIITGYLNDINEDINDQKNYGDNRAYYVTPEFIEVLESVSNKVDEWEKAIPDENSSIVITGEDVEPLLEALILDESGDEGSDLPKGEGETDPNEETDDTSKDELKNDNRALKNKAFKVKKAKKSKKVQKVGRIRKMRTHSNYNSKSKQYVSTIYRTSRRNSLVKRHNNMSNRRNRRNSLSKRRANNKLQKYGKLNNRRTQTLTSSQSGNYYVGDAASYTTVPDLIVTMEGISTIYNLMNSNIPSQSDANQSTLDQIAKSIQTYAKLRNFAIALTANQDKLRHDLAYVKSNLATIQLTTEDVLSFYDFKDRYENLKLKSLSLSALFIEKQKILQTECAGFTNSTRTINESIDYLLYVDDAITQKTQYLRDSPDLGDPASVQYLRKVDQTILLIPVLINMQADVQASLAKIKTGFYDIRDKRSNLNSILTDMELIVAGKYVAANSTTGNKYVSGMTGVSLVLLILGLSL